MCNNNRISKKNSKINITKVKKVKKILKVNRKINDY